VVVVDDKGEGGGEFLEGRDDDRQEKEDEENNEVNEGGTMEVDRLHLSLIQDWW